MTITKQQLTWGLNNLDKLTPHYDEAYFERNKRDGFDYALTLELEGLWLIPDGEDKLTDDFGDTGSGGVRMVDVDPTASKSETKQQLKNFLTEMLDKL